MVLFLKVHSEIISSFSIFYNDSPIKEGRTHETFIFVFYFKSVFKKITKILFYFYFKLIFFVFLDNFDALISEMIFKKYIYILF